MNKVFKLDFSNLRGDFLGGLTAGIVALPLALAFGAQTELGAMAGLYGAIALAILAAFFGGTPTQISGPTAPMTVVSTSVIIAAISQSGLDIETGALPFILATFFLAGVLEMFFGIIKLGKYIRYIPYPVVSGFMSGIGVIIIITQVFPILGYNGGLDTELVNSKRAHAEELILEEALRAEEDRGEISGYLNEQDLAITLENFQNIDPNLIPEKAQKLARQSASGTQGTIRHIARPFTTENGINWINFLLALATILIIYGFKRITKAIPSSLVGLIVVSLVAFFFFQGDVPIIGDVKEGFPPVYLDFFGAYTDLGMLGTIFKYALILAALGAIDSLLTSVIADNMTKTRHDPDQELIGQGIGNMGAAFIGGLPGAGATMRTVINFESGGKTKISGIIAGIFLLAVLLGLGPIVKYIPNGVLAGILFTVGVGIIDYKAFRHIKVMPRSEVFIMLVVLFITVFFDLILAVGVGMVLAALIFMINVSNIVDKGVSASSTKLREFAREQAWEDEGNFVDQYGEKVYIKHLEGPLFFGFSNRFQEMVQALPNVGVVVMRMSRMNYVDQSGLYAMEEAIQALQSRDIAILFTGLKGQPLDMFRRINLMPGLVPNHHCFESFTECRRWLVGHLDEKSLEDLLNEQLEPGRVSDQVDEA